MPFLNPVVGVWRHVYSQQAVIGVILSFQTSQMAHNLITILPAARHCLLLSRQR